MSLDEVTELGSGNQEDSGNDMPVVEERALKMSVRTYLTAIKTFLPDALNEQHVTPEGLDMTEGDLLAHMIREIVERLADENCSEQGVVTIDSVQLIQQLK